MTGKIVLLDGYSLMYRAFHALQTPMTAPDGTPTNAVHGFVMMLLKVTAASLKRNPLWVMTVYVWICGANPLTHRSEPSIFPRAH